MDVLPLQKQLNIYADSHLSSTQYSSSAMNHDCSFFDRILRVRNKWENLIALIPPRDRPLWNEKTHGIRLKTKVKNMPLGEWYLVKKDANEGEGTVLQYVVSMNRHAHLKGGRRSPAVACWASDHWVASSNPLRGKFRH